MIVSVCLNPCLDVYYYTTVLKDDDTNRVENPFVFPGGKGLNAARVIARFNTSATLVTTLGGCIGECVKERLHKEEVPFSYVEIKAETRVNTILEQKGKGTHVLIAARGPRLETSEINQLKSLICQQEADFLILGGSVPPGLPNTFYKEVVEHFKNRNTKVLIDADGELLKNGVEGRPFAIKPNKHELERLVGRPLFDFKDIIDACKTVVNMGVEVVLASLGRYGVVAVTEDSVIRAVPPEVKVVNTVGAGDSVVGGFIYALDKGESLEFAVKFAVACGTATVMREGPLLCEKETVLSLLDRIYVERI